MKLERVLAAVARLLEWPVGRLLSLPPLRSLLRRRALRAWRSSDAPLIICYGNINRSPFAAAFANRRPGRHAVSAGMYPVEGRPSPDALVGRGAALGLDLSGHRSRVADAALLDSAEVIFAFDLENIARVLAVRPRALARTHLLGALGDGGNPFIEDPHGRSPELLDAVLARITQAIEQADGG